MFPNLKCVGGDPMHAVFDLEHHVSESSKLAKDFRRIFVKFNSDATPRFRQERYFDIGKQGKSRLQFSDLFALLDFQTQCLRSACKLSVFFGSTQACMRCPT